MLAKGLVDYTKGDLERMATDLFRRRPEVPFEAPINVELLIERTPNVILKIDDALVGSKVQGYVCKRPLTRELTVGIDALIYAGPWQQYNEVLGEEFAHICIHAGIFVSVTCIEDFIAVQKDPQWPHFESDAKYFSAALRMPAQLVSREAEAIYPRLIDEYGFLDALIIEKMLRTRLAERFRVSHEEMQRRMNGFACEIRGRVLTSVQSRSDQLIPRDWEVNVKPPTSQRLLWQDEAFG